MLVGAAIGLDALPQGRRGFSDTTARNEAVAFLRQHPIPNHDSTRQRIMRESGFLKGEPADAELAAIRVPTLLIWGDDDDLVPPATGERLVMLIPGAKLELVRGAGHIPSVERPAEFTRLIRQFVQ